MTLFEKITQNKETLAEYLLQSCDNPLSETNEDMCDFLRYYERGRSVQ